jgi:hypothetical protein
MAQLGQHLRVDRRLRVDKAPEIVGIGHRCVGLGWLALWFEKERNRQ